VLPLDDLVDDRPVRVVLDGQPILLAKHDGEPHAIGDTCPHREASLSAGIVRDGYVTCPAHLRRFSLHDGTEPGGSTPAVPVYPTRVSPDAWVEIEVPERPPAPSLREVLLAHAREPRPQ
jgi:3-phenylpropionate/trans-cinnamate dioxygenase ferredoxin subunit